MKILVLSQFGDIIENELPKTAVEIDYVRDVRSFDPYSAYHSRRFDCLVCFGYGRVLPVSDPLFSGVRFINLHSSLLPYGRGLNPNLSSWLNNEPHGVTIHEMDETYDTGRILFQKRLELDPESETLRSSYYKKLLATTELLANHWADVLSGDYEPVPQPPGGGSLMTASMLRRYRRVLEIYNDRPLTEFLAAVAEGRVRRLVEASGK